MKGFYSLLLSSGTDRTSRNNFHKITVLLKKHLTELNIIIPHCGAIYIDKLFGTLKNKSIFTMSGDMNEEFPD